MAVALRRRAAPSRMPIDCREGDEGAPTTVLWAALLVFFACAALDHSSTARAIYRDARGSRNDLSRLVCALLPGVALVLVVAPLLSTVDSDGRLWAPKDVRPDADVAPGLWPCVGEREGAEPLLWIATVGLALVVVVDLLVAGGTVLLEPADC